MPSTHVDIEKYDNEGNIILYIIEALNSIDNLRHVQDKVFNRIKNCLVKWPLLISPKVLALLKSIPEEYSAFHGLDDSLASFVPPPHNSVIGGAVFPIVGTRGMVREIRVTTPRGEGFSEDDIRTMVRVGDRVITFLRKKLKIFPRVLWNPDNFQYEILDYRGRAGTPLKGRSSDLALALAIYSAITDIPVPCEVAATAEILDSGELAEVTNASLAEKLGAIERERHYVKRVYVAEHQDLKGIVTSLEILPKASLAQVLEDCFPKAIKLPVSLHLDLRGAMEQLEKQYEAKLFTTYIENALLISSYLEKRRRKTDEEQTARFRCHWRLACCYCHKGNSYQTRRHLELAQAFFGKSKRIDESIRIESRIQQAVDKKDCFQYEHAENLHNDIMKDCAKNRVKPHIIAMNSGAYSQLLLARKRFEEALKFQNEAIALIDKAEVHRNLRDRALIYLRCGKFREAQKDFSKAKREIAAIPEKEKRNGENLYFHWYLAEFFYRQFISTPKNRLKLLNDLNELAKGISEVSMHPQALVLKFAGLAALESGDVSKQDNALANLAKALEFFEKGRFPVLLVIAASIRAHRAIFFLKSGHEIKAVADIKEIAACLSAQKDIKKHFSELLKRLGKCSKQLNNNELARVLAEIVGEIPY